MIPRLLQDKLIAAAIVPAIARARRSMSGGIISPIALFFTWILMDS
jgi:hypothetical protein